MILKDLIAYPSEQGLPYDVVIDTGTKLLKCQVKTTEKPRHIPQRNKETIAYIFHIKRHGTKNTKIYSLDEIDLFALVELQTRRVAYLKNEEMPTTINLRVDDLKGHYYDEKGAADFAKVHDLKSKGVTQTDISIKLDLNLATVNRMWHKKYEPFKTKARYFGDYDRDKRWFSQI